MIGNTAHQQLNDPSLLRWEQLTPEPLEPLQRRNGVRLGKVVMDVASQGGQDLCSCLGRPQNTADFIDDCALDRVRSQAAGTVPFPGLAVLDHVHRDLIAALPDALAKSGKRPFALK